MRAFQLLLALVVLSALLGGAWYLTRDDGSAPGSAAVLENGRAPEQPQALSPVELTDAPESAELEAAPIASERTAVAETAGQEVEAPSGTRAILGRVVDEFGTAVAGARVFAGRTSGFGGIPLERMAKMESPFGVVEETESDGEGRFRMATALRGELRFAVRAVGFAPLRTTREVSGAGEASLEDFVLERSVILSGHVVDEAGSGIPGVAIEAIEAESGSGFTFAFMGGSREPLTRSGAGGAFEVNELAAGPYKLRLSHPEHPDLLVEGLVDRPGQSSAGLRLVMERGFEIAGRVTGLEPGQASELQVRAMPVGGENFDPLGGFVGVRFAELAPDGAFELRGLREGEFRLQAIESRSDMSMFADGRSAATLAETGRRDVRIELREALGLTLRVLDAETGSPVTSYTVEAGRFWMQPLRDAEGQASTEHPDGVATFTDIQPEDVPGGDDDPRTRIKVSAEGYQSLTLQDVELVPGSVVDLGDLRLAPVALISVRVVDATSGEPIEGARVSLEEVEEALGAGERRISMDFSSDAGEDIVLPGQGDQSRGRTDEEGLVELPSLPGKLCELKVTHRSYADYTGEAVMLPESAGLELEARLTAGGTVIVTVLGADGEPKKGVRVRQSRVGEGMGIVLGGGPGSRKSSSKGIVKFAHLAAGLHHFEIQGDAGGGMILGDGAQVMIAGFGAGGESAEDEGVDVEVSEGSTSEITLHASPEGVVTGRVTEAGEPLIGASVTFDEKSKGGAGAEMRMLGFGGGPSARTDSQGRFSLEGLEVGEYTMKISHPTRVMPASFEFTVREGENRVEEDLSVAILEGRVTDSEGKAVAGVEVRPKRYAEAASGGMQRTVMRSFVVGDGGGGAMSFSSGGPEAPTTRTDADGRFVLRGVEHDVELYVEASSARYQEARSEPVTCGENQTRRDVDIEVFEAGHVTVSVLDADGTPASMCLAELEYLGPADPMPDPERGFIGETGETTIDSLRPGRWRVGARSMGMMGPGAGGGDPRTATPVEVEVEAGETAVVTLQLLE